MIKNKHFAGFTLIELLISVGIILVVTGAGIASFVNFNERQQVQQTVNNLKEYMRSAQIKARSGEGADSCSGTGKFYGYRVVSDDAKVYLRKICIDPDTNIVTDDVLRSEFNLDKVMINKNPDIGITFLSLRGGIDLGGNSSVTFTVLGEFSGLTYEFQVLQTGEITEGSFN